MKRLVKIAVSLMCVALFVQEANACCFTRCWRATRCQNYAPCAPCNKTTSVPNCNGGSCPVEEFTPGIDVDCRQVDGLIASINAARARVGCRALRYDKGLCDGAQNTASYNARIGFLQHVMRRGDAGEIIAYNYSGFDAAITQWIYSSGHRAHLFCRDYNRVGVAMVRKNGRYYCAVKFGY